MSRPLNIAEPSGASDRWRRFVFPHSRARNFAQALALRLRRGRVVLVQHGDLECRFSSPPRTGESPSFYAEPWLNPASAYAYGVQHRPSPADTSCVALETDLGAADLGASADKLARLLAALAAELGPDDVVFLSSTCLPSRLGDDARIGELCARSAIGSAILYNAPDVDQAVPPLCALVRRCLERAVGHRGAPSRHRFNLVGFPRGPDKTALVELCASFGANLNVDLLPDVDLGALERFGQAELTLLFPEQHFEGIYPQLFEGLGVRTLAPPAPYGWQGSLRWARVVAEALGLAEPLEQRWRALQRRHRSELDALGSTLAGQAVAFVGSRSELESLTDPVKTQGVAVMAMLAELGLGARWLEHDDLPDWRDAAAGPRRRFGTPAELASLLASSEARLVYSDVAWDERVTRAGKVPISLAWFGLGPAGYLASAARLARACRFDFYARYREYLS